MKSIVKIAALLMLLGALLMSLACSKKQDSPKLEHTLLYFYSETDTSTSFYADGKRLDDRIGGAITTLGTVDGLEGFVVAASALYRIDHEGLIMVYPAAVTNTVPALNGDKLLFATATMVHIYDNATGELTKLEGIEADSIIDLALSPSGSAAGITVSHDGRMMSYLYSGGKVSEYGENRCIVAVSDDADIVYYLDADIQQISGVLHHVKNGKDNEITKQASPYFELNRTLTEITFDIDGKTHISRNGGAAKKLVDSSVLSFAGSQRTNMGGKACTTVLKNTDTMLDGIFYSNVVGEDSSGNRYDQYDVYFVDSTLSCNPLVLGATQFSASDDCKTILTVVDNALYKVTAYNPRSPQLLVNNISMFSCARDLAGPHCLDVYGNVTRLEEGNRNSVILVTGIDIIKQLENGTVLCYASLESNGTLFALKGDRAVPVATGVNYFEVYGNVVTYLTNYDTNAHTYDLYISEDGENYELTEQGVMFEKP